MSDDIKYIDVDDEQFEDAPKALRDAYKALARQHKDVTAEVGQLRQTVASHALGDVLGNAGFKNPKRVEKDILRDGVDATDKAAVEAWLAENGDDYAKATETAGEPAPAAAQTELTPEQKAAQEQLAQQYAAIQGGEQLNAPADLSKWELAKSEITDDMTGEEVLKVYAKHGI
jgi:hypothetical protein